MTQEEYVQAENLMRGKVARQETLRQMMQIDHDSKQLTFAGLALAIYLAFVVGTIPAYIAAIVVTLAAGCILINGGLLLHRKWNGYVATEQASQQLTDDWVWKNRSLEVSPNNRFAVGLTGALAYCLPALLVICYSSYRLLGH